MLQKMIGNNDTILFKQLLTRLNMKRLITNSLKHNAVFVSIIAFLLLSSCNGNGKAQKVTSDPGEGIDTAAAAADAIHQRLFALYLTEKQFTDLMKIDNPNTAGGKLNFQFSLAESGQSPFDLTLVVWPVKNGEYRGKKEYLHIEPGKWPENLSKGDILGGQKLGNIKVQKILNELNKVGSGEDDIIAFEPIFKGKRISYNIRVFEDLSTFKAAQKNTLKKLTSLNPSPPAADNGDIDEPDDETYTEDQ
jgi:hypothetical protein